MNYAVTQCAKEKALRGYVFPDTFFSAYQERLDKLPDTTQYTVMVFVTSDVIIDGPIHNLMRNYLKYFNGELPEILMYDKNRPSRVLARYLNDQDVPVTRFNSDYLEVSTDEETERVTAIDTMLLLAHAVVVLTTNPKNADVEYIVKKAKREGLMLAVPTIRRLK